MGSPPKTAAAWLDALRRRLLAMVLWLAPIRDVDWVAARFGHS